LVGIHFVCVWQGFVPKKPGWLPIREQATQAGTQSISAVECTTVQHHATMNVILFMVIKLLIKLYYIIPIE